MDKKEFIAELREHLNGEVPSYEIEKNIRYYEEYISERGKTKAEEAKCVEEIGEPRLVATTIITSYSMSGGSEDRREAYEEEEPTEEPQQADLLHAIPLKYKVIGILSTIVLLFVLFWVLRVFFYIAVRILFPVAAIAIVIALINKIFNR